MSINTTKKQFQSLVEFLEANKDKKIKDVLNEIYAQTALKVQAKTALVDKDGKVLAVFCYYHKQWEVLDEVEYGKKASSTTGFNTMCKIGTSKWTKQNNAIKQVDNTILNLLESGELKLEDIKDKKEELIIKLKFIDTEDMPNGYQDVEELKVKFNIVDEEDKTSK